jgi:hypothetical protein
VFQQALDVFAKLGGNGCRARQRAGAQERSQHQRTGRRSKALKQE